MTEAADTDEAILSSPLPGVPDSAWAVFVRAMTVAPLAAVSPYNDLGMFAITVRRLNDLGLVRNLRRTKSPWGKTIWVADFNPPLTCRRFLRSLPEQYRAFGASMRDYFDRFRLGKFGEAGAGFSAAGALAVLHRAGPAGLASWAAGNRFTATEEVYRRVEGLF